MTDLFDNSQKFVILSLVQLDTNNSLHVTIEVCFLLLIIISFWFPFQLKTRQSFIELARVRWKVDKGKQRLWMPRYHLQKKKQSWSNVRTCYCECEQESRVC